MNRFQFYLKLILSLLGRYILNVLIAIDQLGNALLLGDPDHTISGRLGRSSRAGCKWCRWFCLLLSKLDPRDGDHCINSIEADRGEASIIYRFKQAVIKRNIKQRDV